MIRDYFCITWGDKLCTMKVIVDPAVGDVKCEIKCVY